MKKRTNRLLTDSLAGSICMTAAILSGKSQRTAMKWFNFLEKNVGKLNILTVKDMVSTVADIAKLNEAQKSHIVLVYDTNNVLTPLVSFTIEAGDEDIVMPLSPDGFYGFGVLGRIGKENIKIEYVYGG